MFSRLRLNRMEVFGLVAVGVTTFLFSGAAINAGSLYASVRHMSVGDVALGFSGWLIATFGPMTLTVAFWRWAKALRKAWMLHLLMLPIAVASVKLGTSLMLSVTGTPDFDDTIGGPVIQAMVLLLLAVIGYYSAVTHATLNRWFAAANGS